MTAAKRGAPSGWWRRAVIYEIYIRSFADADGDGIGDIAGIRSRLGYLRDLGVDALWITPWYPSPMADGGYDVADFRGIDPTFGTLDEAADLIQDAHRHGIRVLIDLVPNHTSDQHPWFQTALASPPVSPERARYHFRAGRGPNGDEPPNDWQSVFAGPAWTRVTEPDGRPGQWYLHLFAAQQPDLDWTNPDVRLEFLGILRTWLDRGVDGFRIDVAHALAKDARLPDLGGRSGQLTARDAQDPHPHWDRDEVHEIYRSWRAVADAYERERVFAAEVHVSSPDRLARYLRPDELHTAFNFDFMRAPWDGPRLRSVIDATISSLATVGAPPTWVLSNHDETRHLTRYGRSETGIGGLVTNPPPRTDLDLGRRRARAAVLLSLALPGCAYLYQGEELGLPDVEDLPDDVRRDPAFLRSGGTFGTRDGCRVPLPWSGTAPPFGFGPAGSVPWLPQPAAWSEVTVEAESSEDLSMLALYRAALRLRRRHPGLATERFDWVRSDPAVLHFGRDDGFACAVNLSDRPVRLPADATILLASVPLSDGRLPVDGAAWYQRPPPPDPAATP